MKVAIKQWLKSFNFFKKINEYRNLPTKIHALESAYKNAIELHSNTAIKTADLNLNHNKRDVKIILSLTTYGSRLHSVHHTIISLLNQTYKADKIVLWLANNEYSLEDLPDELKHLQKFGLEIKLCEDILSYKKLIPALTLYPNDILVTFDDDIVYPSDQLEKLISMHKEQPNQIICSRARKILRSRAGKPLSYRQWVHDSTSTFAEPDLFPVGIGGVLYPPNSLDDEVMNIHAFKQYCPYADDIWFKIMALKKGTLTKLVKDPIPHSQYVMLPNTQTNSLWSVNKSKNDKQLKAVLNAYPSVKI